MVRTPPGLATAEIVTLYLGECLEERLQLCVRSWWGEWLYTKWWVLGLNPGSKDNLWVLPLCPSCQYLGIHKEKTEASNTEFRLFFVAIRHCNLCVYVFNCIDCVLWVSWEVVFKAEGLPMWIRSQATNKQTNKETNKQTNKETNKETNKQSTSKQTRKQTSKQQANKQGNKQRHYYYTLQSTIRTPYVPVICCSPPWRDTIFICVVVAVLGIVSIQCCVFLYYSILWYCSCIVYRVLLPSQATFLRPPMHQAGSNSMTYVTHSSHCSVWRGTCP